MNENDQVFELLDKIEKLEEQIEKMKNVGNCRHTMQCPDWVECFSEARIKCADYEIAIKEYDRGLADGLKVGCVKGRELEKEIAELKAQIEKMKICASSWIMSLEDVRSSKVNDRRGEVLRELEKRVENKK